MKWFTYIGIFMLFIAAAYFGMIWMAPSEVSFQVNDDINAPITEVFDAATNPQKFGKWINGVTAVKQVKGDGAATDSEYDLYFKGSEQMILRQRVTLLESDKTYAYIGTVPDFMEVTSTTSFEAIDNTTTRVQTKNTMKPLSNKMKMFMYAKETHTKNAASNLTRLKEFVEK
jgi:uncharacterized protein YndB with AHSA1/START domain